MLRSIFLVCALLTLTAPVFAQTSDFARLLQGKTHPSSLALKDLNADWRRFSLGSAGGSGMGGFMQMVYAMMGMSGFGASGNCYTKGETVEVADQVFLVVYKVASKPVDITLFANPEALKNMSKGEVLTPETKLRLSLINLKSVTGFYAVRAFDLNREVKESAEENPATPQT